MSNLTRIVPHSWVVSSSPGMNMTGDVSSLDLIGLDRSTEVRMLIGVERCVYSRQAKVSEHEASTDVSDERNATLNLRTTVFRHARW